MIRTDRDPSTMTADERLAEIAQILALGCFRLLCAQNRLEEPSQAEASCGGRS